MQQHQNQQHQNQCLHKAMALPLDKLNKLLRTAALGVEVVQTATKGRGIVATRAHRAGAAVVPAGEPLAHSSKRAVNAFAGHGEFAGSKQRHKSSPARHRRVHSTHG